MTNAIANLISAKAAFKIGSFEIYWYGLILTSGMILGLLYIMWQSKTVGLKKEETLELFLWIIPSAVIFARILYVLSSPESYFPVNSWGQFKMLFAIRDGGITIIGGILGGILGGLIFAYRYRKKVNPGQLFDLVVPALLIGQVVGRWGNFANQEAYGIPITNPALQRFPFAVWIDDCKHIFPDVDYVKVCTCGGSGWHAATCFYEMGFNIIGIFIAHYILKHNKKYPGIAGFFYFAWYFFIRAMMEYLRLDAKPVTQPTCYALFPIAIVLGILYIVLRNKYLKKYPEKAIPFHLRKTPTMDSSNVRIVRQIDKVRGETETSEKAYQKYLKRVKAVQKMDSDETSKKSSKLPNIKNNKKIK